MIEINVTSNVRQFARRLNNIEKRQLPFAISQALSSTAFEGRTLIVDKVFPASFVQRNASFPRALFRVKKATKSNLRASVYQALDRDYMQGHTKGVQRHARSGHLTAPIQANVTKGSRGIPKGKRPRNLPRSFKVTSRRGNEVILQQVGRGKKARNRVMYVLKRTVPNPRRFHFYEHLERMARHRFPILLGQWMRRALATAR